MSTVKMSADDKKYDIVIFGATGFTGQFVVEEIARTMDESMSGSSISWAIAGREMSKLQQVLKNAEMYTGKILDDTPIIIADVNSEASLLDMCKQAKIILNCVGPYQLYGEPVVRACIESNTHHVDICGEPVFLENIQQVFHETAKEKGVYVIQACGFDSIPADMGVTYTRDQFKGDLNHVEAYLNLKTGPEGGCGNIGTWRSAIHGYANVGKLKEIRKKLFKDRLPRGNVKIPKRPPIFNSGDVHGWCIPFVGADRSIVMRSQRYIYENDKQRPIQFNAYLKLPSIFAVVGMMLLGLIFAIFSRFSFGRTLLEKFPWIMSLGLFSSQGPTRQQMAGSSFTMTMVGHGYENKLADINEQHEGTPTEKIITRVSGPDIGYVTTPICMVQAAYVLLMEKDDLPKSGGVYTPGAAFAKTTLIERLKEHNLLFETIKQ